MGIAENLRQQISYKKQEERRLKNIKEANEKMQRQSLVYKEKPFAWRVALAKINEQQDRILSGKSSICEVQIIGTSRNKWDSLLGAVETSHHVIDGEDHCIYDEHLKDLSLLFVKEGFIVSNIEYVPFFEIGYENGKSMPGGGGYSYFNVKW